MWFIQRRLFGNELKSSYRKHSAPCRLRRKTKFGRNSLGKVTTCWISRCLSLSLKRWKKTVDRKQRHMMKKYLVFLALMVFVRPAQSYCSGLCLDWVTEVLRNVVFYGFARSQTPQKLDSATVWLHNVTVCVDDSVPGLFTYTINGYIKCTLTFAQVSTTNYTNALSDVRQAEVGVGLS